VGAWRTETLQHWKLGVEFFGRCIRGRGAADDPGRNQHDEFSAIDPIIARSEQSAYPWQILQPRQTRTIESPAIPHQPADGYGLSILDGD
jgi:hypothetical protein